MSRITRLALRLLPLFGLLLLVGAAVSQPRDQSPVKPKTAVINTGGPVEARECIPCHDDLNDFDNPSLINFGHEVHFKRGIQCRACHVAFPHQPDGLIKPTMDLCINCHRLDHGDQGEMAPGQCELCHPADFNLKPDGHAAGDFAGAGHVSGAKADLQKCLVCHTGESCEDCHAQKGIAPRPAKDYRWFSLLPTPKEQGQDILFGALPVTMGLCQPCHRDLTKWKNDKLINFNHAVHFKKQISCGKCHESWPHDRSGEVVKPKMDACARCHRLDHGDQGQLVKAEGPDISKYCLLCHPKDMKLKPDWHTNEFVAGEHKDMAKADRGSCRMCHLQVFCDNCHQTEIPHAPDWPGAHGQTAVAQAQKTPLPCFRCHEIEESTKKAPSCAKCHKEVVYPHPKPWAPQHGKLVVKLGRASCDTCHRKKAFCDKCHGTIEMPHSENWLGEHREYLRDNEVDVCFSCHRESQCEECHSIHGVHNEYTNFDYWRGGVKL